MIFKGSCTAIVTPLSNDGERVNFKEFEKLIDFQISSGTKALVFLGTTGEPATLSDEEKTQIAKFAIEYVGGRVPVILGAGSNCTQHAIELSRRYESLGADALLHVTPYYNKCTQKGLINHFTEIAKNTSLPVILYNVPGRTGINMLPKTVLELSLVPNIVAVKEASGNIAQIMEIRKICPEGFDVYSGDDGLIYSVLALGGSGVISVLSNIAPRETENLCQLYFSGETSASCRLQMKLNPLIDLLFSEVNPIPVKAALSLMGFNVGKLRLPLTEMEAANKEKLTIEMEKLGML